MEEPSFLMSVNRIVGRIQVQNDLKRRSVLRIQEMVDHQPIDPFWIHHHLLVPFARSGIGACQFQSIQCAFACQRFALISALTPMFSFGIGLADHHGQERVRA